MNVNLNNQYFYRVSQSSSGAFKVTARGMIYNVYSKNMAVSGVEPTFIENLFDGEIDKDSSENYLHGTYFFGMDATSPLYFGDAASTVERLDLRMSFKGQILHIPIHQKTFQPFSSAPLQRTVNKTGVSFWYLGNQQEELIGIPDIQTKLSAIARGVKNVHTKLGVNITDQIRVIDYAVDNASASQTETSLSIFRDFLFNNSVRENFQTAEHETLHRYVALRGLTEDQALRGLFADIEGVEGNQRETIIQTGTTPLADFDSDYRNKLFFAFVDERNYFHEKQGGHSYSNIYEFTTSFVHTLLYIDKLEKNLFTPISIIEDDGKTRSIDLTDDDRRQILAHYEQVLEEIIRIVKASPVQKDIPAKDLELFEKDLDQVKRLSYRMAS